MGKHLFDKVIGPRGMLRDKTRVLVTHRISFLPQVDEIIVLKDGIISESGSYEELLKRKGDFAEFLAEYIAEQSNTNEVNNEDLEIIEQIAESVKPILERHISQVKSESGSEAESEVIKRKISYARQRTVSGSEKESTKSVEQHAKPTQKPPQRKGGRLVEAESSEVGSVKMTVYWKYIQSMGIYGSILILIAFILSNGFQIGYNLWLR